MRLFGQITRVLHIIKRTNVGSLRNVHDCVSVECIVHELVEALFDIVMLKLLAF